MVRKLSPWRRAALAAGLAASALSCGRSDRFDEATRVSVFSDLDTTLARYLAVPTPYTVRTPGANDPARADAERVRQLIGNGLGSSDVRTVFERGAPIAVLQVTVFSALAPDGAPTALVEGFIGSAPVSAVTIAGQALQRVGSALVWRRERLVVVISGAESAALDVFVESYVKGRSSDS